MNRHWPLTPLFSHHQLINLKFTTKFINQLVASPPLEPGPLGPHPTTTGTAEHRQRPELRLCRHAGHLHGTVEGREQRAQRLLVASRRLQGDGPRRFQGLNDGEMVKLMVDLMVD